MNEYKLREKKFVPYRIRAVKLIKKYDDFENQLFGNLKSEVTKLLLSQSDLMSEFYFHKGELTEADIATKSEKFNEKLSEFLRDNKEFLAKTLELNAEKETAKELFLTCSDKLEPNTANARELCEIWFEDCPPDIHDIEREEKDYIEYMDWLKKVFTDFFLKHQRLTAVSVK